MASDYPRVAPELDLLHNMINVNRDAVLWKLEGLTDEQAKRRIVDSHTTLLGIVRHLQFVERWWVRMVLAGDTDLDLPWSKDNPDADWRVTEDDTIEAVLAAYASEVAMTDAIILSLDDLGATVSARGREWTTRWVLAHLIEEIARHAGHADIIREVIDGETGYVR